MQNPAMIASPAISSLSLAPGRLKPTSSNTLTPEAVENILQLLVRQRWQRLSSLYEDPLAVLFDSQTRQWVLGWEPDSQDLYLLVWEQSMTQEKPGWSFYRNGVLLLQEADGASKSRSALLHKLMDSEQLPFLSQKQFLAPLCSYRHTEPSVQTHEQGVQEQKPGIQAQEPLAKKLLETICSRPEIFGSCKEGLFQALEQDLGNPEWPLLDVLKIHRLAHKNHLARLCRELIRMGLIRAEDDMIRLKRTLGLLQEDYTRLGFKIALLFRPNYEHAFKEFRELFRDNSWRPTPSNGFLKALSQPSRTAQPHPRQIAWSLD